MPGSEASAMQLVQVEILPASRPQALPTQEMPEPSHPLPATARVATLSAKVLRNPAPAAQMAQAAKPKSSAPSAVAAAVTAPAAARSDTAGQQLAVRQHLERYKYYPASARRRGITGDVEVGFRLRPDGSAEQVLVLASSGYKILDQAALETVSRAQPFPAAGGQYQFRLRFRRL